MLPPAITPLGIPSIVENISILFRHTYGLLVLWSAHFCQIPIKGLSLLCTCCIERELDLTPLEMYPLPLPAVCYSPRIQKHAQSGWIRCMDRKQVNHALMKMTGKYTNMHWEIQRQSQRGTGIKHRSRKESRIYVLIFSSHKTGEE